MRIIEAIAKADELCPNHFTFQQKLDWCYFVTSMLTEQVAPIYETQGYPLGEETHYLPQGVLFEDVVYIYVNGRKYTKTDERSFGICHFTGNAFITEHPSSTIRVVYRQRIPPYKEMVLEGITADFTANTITFADNPFDVGDNINVAAEEVKYNVNVLGRNEDTLTVREEAFPFEGEHVVRIELIIHDWTICSPPYDKMYIDYLLSQIAYFQNDLEEYNKHGAAFNNTLDSFSRYYLQNQPADKTLKIINRW